jgi:DNA-binding beta-propeller fold protein YncE
MHQHSPRHFDPLRPNRSLGGVERYEFTHGAASVCVYDIHTMDFVKEIPVGAKPDCHSTSLDNRWLYMACGSGLYCIDQESLTLAKAIDTGHVYATNVMPDGDTMLLHDGYGGIFVMKGIQDMDAIHIHKRVDFLHTNKLMDTLGGKGHSIGDGRYYLVCGWEHGNMFLMDLENDYSVQTFIAHDPRLHRGDDLVISRDKTRAYAACHAEGSPSHVAVIDIASRQVIKIIPTGRGTCGMTMTNDERYVIGSNDADDSISVIDTTTDEIAATPSARAGCDALGVTGCIQGISIGQHDEVYVYGCSGSGALVRFTDIAGAARWSVSYSGGKASGDC